MRHHDDFCAFILTHGRPGGVVTKRTLDKSNYSGHWFLIIDDEDAAGDEYRAEFGAENVIAFSKAEIAPHFDVGDNFGVARGVVYARNACFDIAKDLGFKYFMQLDDDYTLFRWQFDDKGHYVPNSRNIGDIDAVLDALIDWYETTPFVSIAMCQGGELQGGAENNELRKIGTKRKAMNTFLCSTERRFEFMGRINEDVNAYTYGQRQGQPFLTIFTVGINQHQTQSYAGGQTGLYLDTGGTYVKSFYSVLYAPSCVRVAPMHTVFSRIHHRVNYNACAPAIIPERYRKLGDHAGRPEPGQSTVGSPRQ